MWVVVNIRVPFLGTLNNRCRIKIGTQKGALILTTTHVDCCSKPERQGHSYKVPFEAIPTALNVDPLEMDPSPLVRIKRVTIGIS